MVVISMRRIIPLLFLGILISGFVYAYFNIISPTFVEKPYLEKPAIPVVANDSLDPEPADGQISEEHINYISNEIGAYKLHEDPITQEKPVIGLEVTDTGQFFTIITDDGRTVTEEGRAADPDIRILGTQEVIISLLSSEDFESEIVRLAKDKKIGIILVSDGKTLALKGYKAIYDAMSEEGNSVTGEAISQLNPVPFSLWTWTLIILFILLVIEIMIKP